MALEKRLDPTWHLLKLIDPAQHVMKQSDPIWHLTKLIDPSMYTKRNETV